MSASVSRRSAIASFAAGVAVGVTPAVLASPTTLAPPLAPGHMLFHFEGRVVQIDTNRLPALRSEREPFGNRIVNSLCSEPEADAKYLVLHSDSRLLVTQLEVGNDIDPLKMYERRLGYVAGESSVYWTSCRVQVLGKVVSS